MHAALTIPHRLVLRAGVIATALMWSANHYAIAIIQPLVPGIQSGLALCTADFRILGTDIYLDRGIYSLRIRADLARPTVVGKRVLIPISSGNTIEGWMDIRLTLGGLLQYPLLLLIVVLAWPVSSLREMLTRLGISMPLVALLFAITAFVTIMAELWFPLHAQFAPGEHWLLLTFSRFMMGGGGQAIALTIGVIAIGVATRVSRLPLLSLRL